MKRRNIGALITGLLLLIIGVGFIGEATHLWNFNLFFPGWWTLFIIIPRLFRYRRSRFPYRKCCMAYFRRANAARLSGLV